LKKAVVVEKRSHVEYLEKVAFDFLRIQDTVGEPLARATTETRSVTEQSQEESLSAGLPTTFFSSNA